MKVGVSLKASDEFESGVTKIGPRDLASELISRASRLATAMVNGGASLKDVSDVLGHKSITTTLIYAKLDLKSLMRVALPWPGGAR